MKNFKRIFVAVLAILAVAAPANAQFRFGLKAGVNINSLHFSDQILQDAMNPENRAGFTGGAMIEFTVPVIGIGMDLSAMYVHRVDQTNAAVPASRLDLSQYLPSTSGDYIELPLNIKYKLGIPAIGNFVKPYVATGPSFAFLCSKKDIDAAWKRKAFDLSWNIGVGLELIKHVQVGASYGIGLSKSIESKLGVAGGETGKSNCWTVTVAYLF